jgi:hypothetical protein
MILMLNVDFRVLPLVVLDGTAQFSALLKYLVPNGRQVLRKGVKLGDSATFSHFAETINHCSCFSTARHRETF